MKLRPTGAQRFRSRRCTTVDRRWGKLRARRQVMARPARSSSTVVARDACTGLRRQSLKGRSRRRRSSTPSGSTRRRRCRVRPRVSAQARDARVASSSAEYRARWGRGRRAHLQAELSERPRVHVSETLRVRPGYEDQPGPHLRTYSGLTCRSATIATVCTSPDPWRFANERSDEGRRVGKAVRSRSPPCTFAG